MRRLQIHAYRQDVKIFSGRHGGSIRPCVLCGWRYNATVRKAPLLLLLAPAFAHSDDGGLTNGGAPRLLGHHPSIRMARERVVVTIRPQGYHVDATFVFRNEGAACAVRMGFPDENEPNESDPGPGVWAKPTASLEHFRSWVDGKAVATTLVRNVKDATTWHTKRVAFGRGATRRVRVAYDADGGGATNSGAKTIRQANYVMRTGASWKGRIGRAELVVRFAPGTLAGEIRPVDAGILKEGPYALTDWGRLATGTVFWNGFATPTVHGRELRFVRRDFEPGEDDDVNVYFGYGHVFK